MTLETKIKNELKKIGLENISGHKLITIVIDGTIYKIGRGDELGCSISHNEMTDSVRKICLSNDNKYFFLLEPEYYREVINNWQYFDWLGEFKSKLSGRSKLTSFGFGRFGSPLQKYLL